MRRNIRAGVYLITNQVNGKFYIGSSTDIDRRWASHRHSFKQEPKYNSRLRSAVQKYGMENFTFALVEECEPIKEVLLAREQHYIDTLQPEYNILPTAGSNLGFKQPPSFFEKRCGSTPWNKGVQTGQDPWNKGIPWDDETKLKISEALQGREAWNTGIPWSEEAKQKMSDAKIGQDTWNKGQTMDDDYCDAMAIAAQARHQANPGLQANLTEAARQANTGQKYSEERCKAQGDGRRGKGSSLKGVARPPELGQKVSEALQTSQKAKAFHESRRGKPSKPSKSGHYGINWRNDTGKFMVRLGNKKYGNFDSLEEAIARRDQVLSEINKVA